MLAFTTEQAQAIWKYMIANEYSWVKPSDITDNNIKAVEAVVMDSPGFWLDMSTTAFRDASPESVRVEHPGMYRQAVTTFWASAWKYARLHGVL